MNRNIALRCAQCGEDFGGGTIDTERAAHLIMVATAVVAGTVVGGHEVQVVDRETGENLDDLFDERIDQLLHGMDDGLTVPFEAAFPVTPDRSRLN